MLRRTLTSVLLLSFCLGLLASGVGRAAEAPDVSYQTVVCGASMWPECDRNE